VDPRRFRGIIYIYKLYRVVALAVIAMRPTLAVDPRGEGIQPCVCVFALMIRVSLHR
jgi:hypothetical protein